jgi:hypothetical protein
MISDEDQIIMETLYWLGIPTLFRFKNEKKKKNCDIALVGHQIVLVAKLPKEINI